MEMWFLALQTSEEEVRGSNPTSLQDPSGILYTSQDRWSDLSLIPLRNLFLKCYHIFIGIGNYRVDWTIFLGQQ